MKAQLIRNAEDNERKEGTMRICAALRVAVRSRFLAISDAAMESAGNSPEAPNALSDSNCRTEGYQGVG